MTDHVLIGKQRLKPKVRTMDTLNTTAADHPTMFPVVPLPVAPSGKPHGEAEPLPMFPDELEAANEHHWANLTAEDCEHLTAPHRFPEPCPWCGGRYLHNPLCDELRASWEPTLPFGKHKGKPLSAVPRDYLGWVTSCGAGISDELRDSIKLRLQGDPDEERAKQ